MTASALLGSFSTSWVRLLVCAVMLAASASSQVASHPIAVFPGLESPGSCGFTVDGIGDLDGDGFPEILVGAPESMGTQNVGLWVGRAFVIAGRDGRRLFDVEGTQHEGRFAWSLRAIGDLDGDTIEDFAIGAPQQSLTGYRSGIVHVYSGKTFTPIHVLSGDPGDFLGISIANAKDVDGDGVNDILTGGHGGNPINRGVAILWSGKTGARLHRFVGAKAGDFLGHTVEAGADLDGDGTPDIVLGIPDEDTTGVDAGRVEAYSGKTFQILWHFGGEGAGDLFGHSIAIVGDIDKDGVADIAVGAPQLTTSHSGAGYAHILSGKTGLSLRRLAGHAVGDWFSEPVEDVGDWNGDGTPDLLVGSSRASHDNKLECGRADIISGLDGSRLQTWFGEEAGAHFGYAMRIAGDFDANGNTDFVVGAPGASSGRGLVQVRTKQNPELTIGFNEASISNPNQVPLRLELAKKYEGQIFFTLGSVSGRSPGISVGPVTLPLKGDVYTDALLLAPNTFVRGGLGLVPFGGKVSMSFGLSPGFSSSLVGLRIEHAVLLIDVNKLLFTHSTNAVTLRLVQ